MDRSIIHLRPEFLPMVVGWQGDMVSAGINYIITCTVRTAEEQALLYAKGRTAPGRIVTKAKPGQSAHEYGLALDYVVLEYGKPDWDGEGALWDRSIELAEARGMQSLRPMESAHLQHPDWRLIAGVPHAT